MTQPQLFQSSTEPYDPNMARKLRDFRLALQARLDNRARNGETRAVLTKLPRSSEKWLMQELEEVLYRLALKYFPDLTFIEGNAMSVDDAVKHLDGCIVWIRENMELYRKLDNVIP